MLIVLAALIACGPKQNTNNGGGNRTKIILDGAEISGTWDDGDTFRWSEDGEKHTARLNGFNTLESYGAVHQWGGWSRNALAAIADEATAFARSDTWECTTLDGGGGYGRDLIDCPQLRARMLRKGLAHVYTIDSRPSQDDLTIQANAIASKAGMWKAGAPDGIVTSAHSRREDPDKQAYDRVCSTTTGRCRKVEHNVAYDTCQPVEHEGSSLLYVPYENRYENKPDCLR